MPNTKSSSSQGKREEDFEAEVRKLAEEKFPDLEGRFALAKLVPAIESPASDVASVQRRKCLLKGTDPVTGKTICILWG